MAPFLVMGLRPGLIRDHQCSRRWLHGKRLVAICRDPVTSRPLPLPAQFPPPRLSRNASPAIVRRGYDRYGHTFRHFPSTGPRTIPRDGVSREGPVCPLNRANRPGQGRRLPYIMPALPLFAQRRRGMLVVTRLADLRHGSPHMSFATNSRIPKKKRWGPAPGAREPLPGCCGIRLPGRHG